jgi:hypothetical protein
MPGSRDHCTQLLFQTWNSPADVLIPTFIVLMSSKKRKLSGLTGMELRVAYNSLLKLKKAIVYEESEEEEDPDAPSPESFEEQVDTMLSLLGSKLEGPQV